MLYMRSVQQNLGVGMVHYLNTKLTCRQRRNPHDKLLTAYASGTQIILNSLNDVVLV